MGRASNPFSPSHWTPDTIRYRFESGQAEEILAAFRKAGYSGWICGPHGAGKSTLLAELERQFSADGISCYRMRATWDRISHARVLARAFATRRGQVLLLDSGECMPAWLLRIIRRWLELRGVGLIATVHQLPVGMGPGQQERAPVQDLPCVHLESRAAQMTSILREELEGQPGVDIPTEDEIENLLQRHGGNAREMLADLYLALERMDRP